MISSQPKTARTGRILYYLGAFLAIAFLAGAVWGDMEASLFDSSLRAQKRLKSFRCPVAITRAETGQVTLHYTNRADRKISTLVQTHVSDGFISALRELESPLELGPGESKTLSWEVVPTDAVWNRVIMARAFVFPSYLVPTQTEACGILVFNLPFVTGAQLVMGMKIASLLLMATGILLARTGTGRPEPKSILRPGLMLGYALLLAFNLVFHDSLGWFFSGLLLIFAFLMALLILATPILRPASNTL